VTADADPTSPAALWVTPDFEVIDASDAEQFVAGDTDDSFLPS
jgi:hypothetical protein